MSHASRRALVVCALIAPALYFVPSTLGYGYYRYGNGRADFNSRYDLVGNPYPGQANVAVFNFGQIDGFTAGQLTTLGLTAGEVNTAIANASAAWESYLNIDIANNAAANGTGNILRLKFDNTAGTGAYTLGYQHTGNNWTDLGFKSMTTNAANNPIPWTPTNFEWTLKHELGHALGIRDMYPDFAGAPYAEDFVDHPVTGNPNPHHSGTHLDPNDGRRDNLMDRPRFTSYDYSMPPQTNIDNDEVAGGTWLWGGKYNQIVTGDLVAAWDGPANSVRRIEEHHGDQPTNAGGLGWWDYRVSVKPGGAAKPHVDVYFPGYLTFAASLYDDDGNVPAITETPLGNEMHRFEINEAGWGGNIELYIKSQYSEETYVRAIILGGGRTDNFTIVPGVNGIDFTGGDTWAQVFGPVPEPSCLALSAAGLLTLVRRKRR